MKYCEMCDRWFTRGTDCPKCGAGLQKAERVECPQCDGDGFGPNWVGNCERCGGGGKVNTEA